VNRFCPPVVVAPAEIAASIQSICSSHDALESLERIIRTEELELLPLLASGEWQEFSAEMRTAFASRDHVLIKGLPVSSDGATLLVATLTIGAMFRTYRGGQIIKHFKMSPWTTDLSHTIREGEFHTDLNTEFQPPAITAMQCLDPDPGAPRFGANRVARLTDLVDFFNKCDDKSMLRFLTQETVAMLNDRSVSSWEGCIIEKDVIRYHPETLRAAARRSGNHLRALQERIASVASAALSVSEPFILDSGDILLLSNHRTLHYRGECSVVFKKFPTEFVSRSIFILHASKELKGS